MSPSSNGSSTLQPSIDLPAHQAATDPSHELSTTLESIRLPPPVIPPQLLPISSVFGAQLDPLQQLHNRAARLTSELQQLIDAQAGALLGNINETVSFPAATAVNSPAKLWLSLSDARNGLLTAMGELADVKAREAMIYGDLAAEQREMAEVIRTNIKKTSQLQEELSLIHASPEAVRAEQLREERAAIAQEIEEVQQKLRGLEMKHRDLGIKITELDNVIRSRAVPYEGSLNSLTKKTTTFLTKHQQLNPESALEAWVAGSEECTLKMGAAAREKEALEAGITLWHDCLFTVRGYETMMREKVRDQTVNDPDVRKGLFSALEGVIQEVEEMVSIAERSGWNLLQACIRSELQALREAGAILSRHVSEP